MDLVWEACLFKLLHLQVDENELKAMATDGTYWKSPDFVSLAQYLNRLILETCKKVDTLTTPAPVPGVYTELRVIC